MFGVSSSVHIFSLCFAFGLDLLDDFLDHLRLLLGLDLLEHLVEPIQLLLGPEFAIGPQQPGRVSVSHVSLESLLGLEVHLTLFTLEQTHIVNLEMQIILGAVLFAMLHSHLVLVPVPVRPAGRHLTAQLARASAVVVDQIIQCQVIQSVLLVSNNQGPLNILKQILIMK